MRYGGQMDNLQIQYLDINELTPYEKNTRKHTKEDVKYIENSIKEFGMIDPIGIWGGTNIIVEGHGRYMACKNLGITEVPTIRLDNLTDEQRRAYAIAHNKTAEMSSWDLETLELELNDLDLDMSMFGFSEGYEEEEVEEDNYEPVIPEEPNSRPGDIYLLGDHRLMVGDSTNPVDVETLMDGHKADLVQTDPPYNVNVSNSAGMTIENDNMDMRSFQEFILQAMQNISDALKPGGVFYIWHGSNARVEFESAIRQTELGVHQELIWNKNQFTLGRNDYQNKMEPCLYGWKEGAGHYFVEDRTQSTVFQHEKYDFEKMKKEEMVELLKQIYSLPMSVFDDDKPKINDLHPTMKPITLIGKQIANSSKKGELVLDLFGGSGSTMIACEQLGRACYMMEYDPHYADVIIDRWETFTGKEAIKL